MTVPGAERLVLAEAFRDFLGCFSGAGCSSASAASAFAVVVASALTGSDVVTLTAASASAATVNSLSQHQSRSGQHLSGQLHMTSCSVEAQRLVEQQSKGGVCPPEAFLGASQSSSLSESSSRTVLRLRCCLFAGTASAAGALGFADGEFSPSSSLSARASALAGRCVLLIGVSSCSASSPLRLAASCKEGIG